MLRVGERWVKGFEGSYSVNMEGDVLSHKRIPIIKLAGGVTKSKERGESYRVVCLSMTGVNYTKYIHRLVAEAFIPNPDNKPQVNHIDGNKLNNCASNLEWVTGSENVIHAYDNGFMKTVTEEEMNNRIHEAIFGKYDAKNSKRYLTDEILVKNHIPPEMLNSTTIKVNFLKTWNYYIDIFKLCDDNSISSTYISRLLKIDLGEVSRVRNGKRLKRARRIYDKYKDNSHYFVNYPGYFNCIE